MCLQAGIIGRSDLYVNENNSHYYSGMSRSLFHTHVSEKSPAKWNGSALAALVSLGKRPVFLFKCRMSAACITDIAFSGHTSPDTRVLSVIFRISPDRTSMPPVSKPWLEKQANTLKNTRNIPFQNKTASQKNREKVDKVQTLFHPGNYPVCMERN